MNTNRLSKTIRGATAVLLFAATSAKADRLTGVSQFDSSLVPSATAGGSSSMAVFSPDGRYVAFASTAKNLALTTNQTPFAPQFWPCFNVYLRDRTNGTTTLVSISADGTGGATADAIPTGISSNGQFVLFESVAGNLVTNQTTGNGDIFVRDVINGQTILASINTNGAGGNAVSRDSVMTADGRYVAFASLASDLAPNDTNGIYDVFIRDTVGGLTQVVSAGASGVAGSSRIPLITADGRYVLFYSTATNLVPGAPSIGELFMCDTVSNTTTWVSAGAQGVFQSLGPFSSNSIAFNAVLSDDGNHVAYEACSSAYPNPAFGVILRYTVQTGLTDIVHTNAFVQPPFLRENQASLDMTPDGRFIAFVGNVASVGTNSQSGFTNAVYLWDATTGSNVMVSINRTNGVTRNTESDLPVVSTNGQFVTFLSSDTNLTTNVLNGVYHLYRRDMLAGVTQLVDVDTNNVGAGVTPDTAAVMSPDGSFVAYQSNNGNIVANDRNRDFDLFINNFANQQTELISARNPALPSSTPDGLSGALAYSVNANGRFIAFVSEADDVAPNDTNGQWDVFVRDLQSGTNTLASIATTGFSGNGNSFEPSLSGDGRYVVFSSYASNLVAGDTNKSRDVFVRDLQARTTKLVSIGQDGVSFGNGNSWQPTISADGRYVLFHSLAQNLGGTISSLQENIFVRDLGSNVTYAIASVAASPALFSAGMTSDGHYVGGAGQVSSANGNPFLFIWNTQTASMVYTSPVVAGLRTSISPNGKKIAWWNTTLNVTDWSLNTSRTVATGIFGPNAGMQFSADGNLVAYAMGPSNFTPNANSLYLYNFQAGSNMLVSHAYNSTNPAAGSSDWPAISADGRFIVYRSAATNLVAGVTSGQANLFVFDATTGVNSLLSQNNSQTGPANYSSLKPVFSGDGRTVFFQSWATDLTSAADFNANADLFAYAFPYLQIAPPISALAGPVFTWPAVPGQTYTVQYLDSLAGGPWQTLSGTLAITGNQAVFSNTPPVSGQRFFRLMIQ